MFLLLNRSNILFKKAAAEYYLITTTMSSFRPRWGNVPATSVVSTNVQRGPQPIAQDVVPHVPYHTGRAGQGGPTLGAMDSAPVGMYNKPRSALQPLMGNSAAPRSAEKSKRDEMWERKREQFMVKKGMSPEPDRAAAAAAAPRGAKLGSLVLELPVIALALVCRRALYQTLRLTRGCCCDYPCLGWRIGCRRPDRLRARARNPQR